MSRLSLVTVSRGYSLVVVHWIFIVVASLVVAHGALGCEGFSSCSAWASLLHGVWSLLRPGTEPVFPALAGQFSTAGPPGKSKTTIFMTCENYLKFKIRCS